MVKFFKTPFANNGDKLNIPEELQEDGSISFDQGYGEDYEKNRKTDPDAKNISRQSFNGLLYDITDAIGDIQRSGVAKWSDEVTYNKGSLVWHNKSLYSSLLDSNKSQPPSASWTTLLTKESLDLSEYRKKDDNVFNGLMTIKSDNIEQGVGIFLQDTDGTTRGQVVATDQGLQLAQVQEDGTSQTFTFPSVGGEVATTNYVDDKIVDIDTSNLVTKDDITNELGDSTELVASQALVSNHGLGYGQQWIDVTSERVAGTTYTNNTGKTIVFSVSSKEGASMFLVLLVDGKMVASYANNNGSGLASITLSAIVPPNSTYSSTHPHTLWSELR